MSGGIERRIAMLERRADAGGGRHIHTVLATDETDSERQIADLLASGVVGPRDGFLCITGRRKLH